MPICPSGHKLRSPVLGSLTELPLAWAILRGLGFSVLGLVLGMIQDFRLGPNGRPHFGLIVMTGVALIVGIVAMVNSWLWAGLNGPVHRLTSRALGMALGSLLPGITASHALYFRWADSLHTVCCNGIVHLVLVLRSISS